MLILSRRPGQSVILTLVDGQSITVHYSQAMPGSSQIRLGFDAPADVRILRNELARRPVSYGFNGEEFVPVETRLARAERLLGAAVDECRGPLESEILAFLRSDTPNGKPGNV